MSPLLAAESARLETMVRFFVVAAVLVSPAAFIVIRRLLRPSAPVPHGNDDDGPPRPTSTGDPEGPAAGPPTLHDDGSDEGSDELGDGLATLVAHVDRAATAVDRATAGGHAIVVVPPGLVEATVPGGAPGGTSVARLVLDDAARRGGLRTTWARRDDGGWDLHLRAADVPDVR